MLLPGWVATCCGLKPNSLVGDLADVAAPDLAADRSAVDFFLSELFRRHGREIAAVRVFPSRRAISWDHLDAVQLPSRVRKGLVRAGFKESDRLTALTYGELLELKGVGVKSVIDFGLQAEQLSIDFASDPSAVHSEAAKSVDEADVLFLRQLAEADWSELIASDDPRFSDLLTSHGESLASISSGILSILEAAGDKWPSPQSLPNSVPPLAVNSATFSIWLRELRSRITALEQMKLEELLADYLQKCSGLKGKRLDSLLARLGWSGQLPLTLEESGKLLGVTRERLRQIESKTRKKFSSKPVYAPALTRALQVFAEAAPTEIEKAATLLQARGISRSPFSAESVLSAAKDLGIEPPVGIASARGVHVVTRAAHTAHLSTILAAARKRSGASGVVSTLDVATDVSRKSHVTCSESEVTRTLEASKNFRHLHGPWFWATDLPSGRNRLVNVCTNMLSVTSPISIARLRDGIRREYTFRNLSGSGKFDLRVAPADVLRAFLNDHPDFVVNDTDQVRPIRPLDYRQVLGPSDQVLVDVLRSSPSGVLDRATIVRECVDRGVNVQTLNVDLTYSCLVEHVDTNIWTLRGADVNPAAIEALRHANALRPRERRVRDFGWTAEGNLWIAAIVPPITQPFVFGSPPGSRAYLAGNKFSATIVDGTPCGTLGVTEDGTVYGFSTFQQVSGCDPGDVLVVEFNLSDRTAKLVLGSEELLDLYGAET